MKINVFKIPFDKKQDLKNKFKKIDLIIEDTQSIDGWSCSFYLSKNPEIKKINWVKDYEFFIKTTKPENKIYYAVFLCEKDKNIFAITYGKSHFYVRQFCDDEFGLEIAKRIANENDIKQMATKRFNNRKKKEIKSYTQTSILDNESGESIEHLNAAIVNNQKLSFGNKAKFGNSLLLSLKELEVTKIPEVLNEIIKTLKEKQKFDIPKTIEIKDNTKLLDYYNLLVEDILKKDEKVTLSTQSYDIVGTDFVFTGNERYKYKYSNQESNYVDDLEVVDIVNFINKHSIPKDRILNHIKIEIEDEGRETFIKPLVYFINYNIENENIIFQNGKWIKFNEEYVKQINDSISSIAIIPTENKLGIIKISESEFNYLSETSEGKKKGVKINKDLIDLGYKSSDKDFSKLLIKGNYKIEAWDLEKDKVVYAVKFGNTQKLSYVCLQALNTLEVIRNNASLNKLDNPPEKYCLWFGITNKNKVDDITKLNSIILKQQIDLFGRKCRDIGIIPLIKISKKQ
ncbi:MAG: TIGR04141 family sporadically distributed protein [Clostridia bacterium]|nr:TIGR04141 family sporadically distributed protein [Clostridia bacterium]